MCVCVCVLTFSLSYMLCSPIKSTLCLVHEVNGSILNTLTYTTFSIELSIPVLRIKFLQVHRVSKNHFESRFIPSFQQIGLQGLGSVLH